MGQAGSKGDTGDKGPQGLKGDTGPKGDKGDTGPKGQDGVLSLDSLNATQFDRLLKSILDDSRSKGPKGDTGPQGVKGDTGIQGIKGDTGIQGIKGDKGDKGDTGVIGPVGPAGPALNDKPVIKNKILVNSDVQSDGKYSEFEILTDYINKQGTYLEASVPGVGGKHIFLNPRYGGSAFVGYNALDTLPNTRFGVNGGISASSDGFQTGGWKISSSGDNLCMQNGTNPPFCINKYGILENKKKIVFPSGHAWPYLCLNSDLIGSNNNPVSGCEQNDDKMYFYFEDGGLIRLAKDKNKCITSKEDKSGFTVADCNPLDLKQKFFRYYNNLLLNAYTDKCVDKGNPNMISGCSSTNSNQHVSFIKD